MNASIQSIILPSPAKLNLFLHITGKRADGYHNLQTVFQLLDFGDSISFSLREDGLIKVSCQIPIPLEENLIYRVANDLKNQFEIEKGIDIVCHKKIPLGAGLGGGSSNAATTLHALNYLWELNLSTEELAAIGLKFGADVPVFVWGNSAWAEGVGEKLQALELSDGYYLIIVPTVNVSTAKLFSHPKLKRDFVPLTAENWNTQKTENAFLDLVLTEYPEIKAAYDWMNQFAEAKLTGTGAALFAYFENREEAEKILEKKPEKFQVFIARAMQRSPLHKELEKCF